MWSPLCAVLLICALLGSCDKTEQAVNGVKPASGARSAAKVDPFGYAEVNLKRIGKGVLLATMNNNFRNLVYSEIEKKFDGDYNVLTKTLDQKSRSINIKLNESIRKADENSSEEDALSAFANIDGKSYNPQVFIPFYEELKKIGKLGIANPVLVVFNGKREEKDLEEGYTLENGKINKLTFSIDEEYAKTHEVWVLSISDRTGGDLDSKSIIDSTGSGLNKKPANDQSSNKAPKGKNGRIAAVRDHGYLTGVSVSTNKESWASGANDVYVESLYSNGYIGSNQTGLQAHIGDWSENQFGEFRTYEYPLKEIVIVDENTSLFGSITVYGPNGHQYSPFVLYEKDNWPESIKIAHFSLDGRPAEIGYRSAESPYMSDIVDARKHFPIANSVYRFDRNNGSARVTFGVQTFQ
jgi:hypothetical protein